MAFPIVVDAAAEHDLEDAVRWYDDQRGGLGTEFLAKIEESFQRIAAAPEIHAISYRSIRQTLVRRFPYVVCYDFDGHTVTIVAVFHGHRDPTTWQRRLS